MNEHKITKPFICIEAEYQITWNITREKYKKKGKIFVLENRVRNIIKKCIRSVKSVKNIIIKVTKSA